MKILFLRSGNNGVDPISTSQGLSLEKKGVQIIYFDIVGKRVTGYLRNVIKLRSYVKNHKPDIIHAHYSLSGIVAGLSFSGIPVGVSLMGSDVLTSGEHWKMLIKVAAKYWSFTIVKSREMYELLEISNSILLPNGVDFELFYPMKQDQACSIVGWDQQKKHIICASDPRRRVKNFQLAKKSLHPLMLSDQIEVHLLNGISFSRMVYYYNAADLVLLTSLSEGSPNVIKEAMACNCPVVATDVGDIREVVGKTEGCYLTSFDPQDVANSIEKSLARGKRTNGRNNIQHLDSAVIADRIIQVYKGAVKR